MHEDFEEIKSTYKGKKSDIIPLLQDIQIKYGYLPEK